MRFYLQITIKTRQICRIPFNSPYHSGTIWSIELPIIYPSTKLAPSTIAVKNKIINEITKIYCTEKIEIPMDQMDQENVKKNVGSFYL